MVKQDIHNVAPEVRGCNVREAIVVQVSHRQVRRHARNPIIRMRLKSAVAVAQQYREGFGKIRSAESAGD